MSHADGLSRGSPEGGDVASRSIEAFLDDASASEVELHSYMLYRNGKVISEGWWWPYRAHLPHALHSATKSFLSVAVGLAVQEGFFKLCDKAVSFFPDRVPKDASPRLLAMSVENLLTQTSGHGHGQSGGEWRSIEGSWIDKFFTIAVDHDPGTAFVYSSATSFMLSAIISKTTGQCVRDFLEPRLFRPLGIKLLTWDVGPEDVNPGGNGISCTTLDFLKLGILHLQGGVWDGKRILAEDWVQRVATPQVGEGIHSYHWWHDREIEGLAYFASGMFGQFCYVFPDANAVLAVTAASGRGSYDLRRLIRRHFPALFTAVPEKADEGAAQSRLKSRSESLRLLLPLIPSPTPEEAIAITRERFVAKANEDGIVSFALDFQHENHCVLHIQDMRGFHRVNVGLLDWYEGTTSLTGAKLHHGYEWASLAMVAGGRWPDKNTFEVTLQFSETAFRDTIVITFFNDYTAARLDRSVNVNSFSTKRPTVLGTILIVGDELQSLEDSTKKKYSIRTSTIGELLDNSETLAILQEEIPHIINDSGLEKARIYTFDMVFQRVQSLTPELIFRIEDRITRL